MSDINEILADVKQEGDTDPFAALEKDTQSESPPEAKPEEAKEKEQPKEGEHTPDENIPFHTHPRWIEREKQFDELRAQREKDARDLQELRDRVSQRTEPGSEIPDWFKELYGDNAVAWEKYSAHEGAQREQIKQELLQEQVQVQQQAREEETYWNNWVGSEIDKLASSGKQFDRNELMKVMLEYKPTDDQNNLDFAAGYRIYEAMNKGDPAKSQARKQFADSITNTKSGDKKAKDYMTPADLRNTSWHKL